MASNLPDALTNAVLASISQPSYSIDPPKLSPELWDRVCVLTPEAKAENERLEFLGDALMDACFGIELYKQVPDGTPHMYTEIRSALHRNLAFCHLANKMGISTSGQIKSIGDVFETLMGAYYTEKGFDALYEWTRRAYAPIIQATVEAFYRFSGKRPDNAQDKLSESLSSFSLLQSPSAPSIIGKGKRKPSASFPLAQAQSSSSRRSYPFGSPSQSPSNTSCSSSSPSQPGRVALNASDEDLPSNIGPTENGCSTRSPLETDTPTEANFLPPFSKIPLVPDSRPIAVPISTFVEEAPLPDFWEEVRTPDGKVFYVDHKTQITTWDDPRQKPYSDDPHDDSSTGWTARLMAPLPDIPQTAACQTTSLSNDSTDRLVHGAVIPPGHPADAHNPPPFPDLLQDGYILGTLPDDVLLAAGAVPDFWEVRQGNDGRTYFIDHVAAIITRQEQFD